MNSSSAPPCSESVHHSRVNKSVNRFKGPSEAVFSVHLSFSYSLWMVQTPVPCLFFQLALARQRLGNLLSGQCSAFCWGRKPVSLQRRNPGGPRPSSELFTSLSPDCWAGFKGEESHSAQPSSWWRHSLLLLSPPSWLCSWGSVRTPPGSTSLLRPEADESVLPFWPVPAYTRTSPQAPPLLQTYMATCG